MRHFQLVHAELMASYFGCDKSATSCARNKRKPAARKRRFLLTYKDPRNTAQVEQTPWNSLWYIEYVLNGDHIDKDWFKEFCSWYRVQYTNFKELLQELGNHIDCAKWTTSRTKNANKCSSSLSLLLLGALRYLDRGGCFYDCQHGTNMNKETHNHFFHLFLKYASSVLFP